METTPYSRVKLAVGEGCNLNCAHCYLGKQDPRFIDIGLATRIMDEAKEIGVSTMDFTGGEPLIHPSFADIVEYAGKKGFNQLNVSTNAIRLSVESILDAVEKNRVHCNISLDGTTEKTTDSVRGPGSFQKIMKILEELKKRGVSYSLRFSINKRNKDELVAMVELGRNLGVKIDLSPTQLAGSAGSDLILSNDDITEIRTALGKLLSSTSSSQEVEESFVGHEICDGGDPSILAVNIDGVAVSCFMVGPTHKFDDPSLKGMWDCMQPEKRRLNGFSPTLAQCAECDERGICDGGCNITAINKGCLNLQ
ncbi:MAG: radical SAM protein [Patescibacteria group bacterium]